jgi:protein-S-isoprenylcysteine O-methyltransferase Ste14
MNTLLRVVGFPAAIAVVVLACIAVDANSGVRGPQLPGLGALLMLFGSALAGWCVSLLFLSGRGTPHPFAAKTKRLVASGPYAVVRNPMVYGMGLLVLGAALWLGSGGLWLGFVCLVLFVLWFVPGYEEHDMERRFGEEYRQYCRRVPRWIPRLWS